jgi:hypothetical protein
MLIILNRKITAQEFEQAREIYKDYIKTVVDVENNILAVGGEYHIDCEEVLIQQGSKLENLYGGGYRVSTKDVEYMAMSNYKPSLNRTTYEVTDPKIREIIYNLTKEYLDLGEVIEK